MELGSWAQIPSKTRIFSPSWYQKVNTLGNLNTVEEQVNVSEASAKAMTIGLLDMYTKHMSLMEIT